MPFDQVEKSPGHRRSRSRTPYSRRARDSSIETINRATSQDEGNPKSLQRYGRYQRAESIATVTTFPNSSGPQGLSDSVPGEDGGGQTKQKLLDRLAQALRENEILSEENKRVGGVLETSRGVSEALYREVQSCRQLIDDKSSECTSLRDKIEEISQATNRINTRSQSWGFSNIFPRSRDGQKPEDNINTELREKLARYKRHLRDLAAENRELHQRTTTQARQLQAQSSGFAQELDDLKSKAFVKCAKVSDTEVQGKWKTLGFSIRQFVMSHFPVALDRQTVQLLAPMEEFMWLPEMATTLQTPMVCHIVLESWIWHFLCFRVFDSHSDFWAGEVGKTLNTQCDQLRGIIASASNSSASTVAAVAQFHEWRVRSVDFISRLGISDERSSIMRVADEMTCFLRFAASSANAYGQISFDMRQEMLGILQKASQLAGIFRTSKADFQVFITRVKLPLVKPPSFGFPFDPETMECVKDLRGFPQGDSAPVVDLAVSPGIFKVGNSDGENYDSERVLVKLQALCNLQTVLGFFHRDEEHQEPSDAQGSLIQTEDARIKNEDQWEECEVKSVFKAEPED